MFCESCDQRKSEETVIIIFSKYKIVLEVEIIKDWTMWQVGRRVLAPNFGNTEGKLGYCEARNEKVQVDLVFVVVRVKKEIGVAVKLWQYQTELPKAGDDQQRCLLPSLKT